MKEKLKLRIATILSLILTLGLLPGISLTAHADGGIDPTGVTLDKHQINVDSNANDQTLTATIAPDDAQGNLIWNSNNTSVASVTDNQDNTASVTINGVGTANITVVVEGTEYSDVCNVTVSEYICPHTNKTETPARTVSCTENGNNKYYRCNDCNKYLKADGTTETTVENETIPALGHNYENVSYSFNDTQHWKVCSRCNEDSAKENHLWGVATYVWNSGNSSATASHSCSLCGKEVTEIVDSTSQIIRSASCTEKEITRYMATFTKAGFTTQTKNVETGNALGHDWGMPTYDWSNDNSTLTAERACIRQGCSEKETETVNTTMEITATCTEAGVTAYTATFTNNAFQRQTYLYPVDALGHDWNEVSAVAATCTTAGNSAYKQCKRCREYQDMDENQISANSWVIAPLGHKFTYAANEANVKAKCENDSCEYHNSPAILTIVAPTQTTYGGAGSASASLKGLEAFNSLLGLSISEADIKYVGRDDTVYAESTVAPTGIGKYTASIIVKDVTAKVNYEIAKGVATITAPRVVTGLVENGSMQELIYAGSAEGGEMQYALGTDDKNAPASDWSTSIPTATNAGTYYVWYRVVADNNHKDVAPVCMTVTINKKAEVIDKDQKTTTLSKPKAGKKSFTLEWKKQAQKGIKGYEIQYSTDKHFEKNVKTITISKTKTTSKTIKKLKSGKKYYVRIRTFTKKNGEKVYSKWSKTKSVKVK